MINSISHILGILEILSFSLQIGGIHAKHFVSLIYT